MKNTLYRIVTAIVVFLLLIVTMTACSTETDHDESLPAPTEERTARQTDAAALQEAKNVFLADWENFLAISEKINSRMMWALDYAEAFVQDSTWDNLLKARAACGAVKQEFQLLDLPERALTETQYFLLMDVGIEADVLLVEYENLHMLQSLNLSTLENLEKSITFDIFFQAVADNFPDWIENEQKLVQLDNAYLCITTNYLLLQLDDDSLWGGLKEKYPVIGSACGEWTTDAELLMRNCKTVLDQGEKIELSIGEYIGVFDYTVSIVKEAATTGDLERLAAQMNDIPGVPAYFPLPDWMSEAIPQYYLVTDPQSQELRPVAVGEEISQTPAVCYISYSGISREDVERYGDILMGYGLEPYSKWNDEAQNYQMLITGGESQMMVQWTKEETIIYLNGTVGCLIPELYLEAMCMN